MSRIFISHSSVNNAEALALCDWMMLQGWDDVFLDIDPERGLVTGEKWEAALRKAAGRCEIVIFLISREWLGSQWCRDEFNLARHLNKRLFGILIEDIPKTDLPPALTREWQLTDLAVGEPRTIFEMKPPPRRTTIEVHAYPLHSGAIVCDLTCDLEADHGRRGQGWALAGFP